MDERKLTDLLRDAVADPPPSTFDQHDVARESGRLTRRRNRALTGSAFGVAILAGVSALSVALWTGSDSVETNAGSPAAVAGNENAAPYELPEEDGRAGASTQRGDQPDASPESRKQGRSPREDAGSIGPGSAPSGCEQADRELAAALAGELPAAAQSGALPGSFDCREPGTTISYRLTSGYVRGTLLPPNTTTAPDSPDGWQVEEATATTEDGRVLVIFSTAPGGAPPYSDVLQEWADRVALRF